MTDLVADHHFYYDPTNIDLQKLIDTAAMRPGSSIIHYHSAEVSCIDHNHIQIAPREDN